MSSTQPPPGNQTHSGASSSRRRSVQADRHRAVEVGGFDAAASVRTDDSPRGLISSRFHDRKEMKRTRTRRETFAAPHADLRVGPARAAEHDSTRSHRSPEQRRIVERRRGTNRLQRPDIRERVVQRAPEEIPGARDRPTDHETACGERAHPRLEHLSQSGSGLGERHSSALVACHGRGRQGPRRRATRRRSG